MHQMTLCVLKMYNKRQDILLECFVDILINYLLYFVSKLKKQEILFKDI